MPWLDASAGKLPADSSPLQPIADDQFHGNRYARLRKYPQQYHGDRTINHLDAYRVRDEDEFRALGIDELFTSDAITIIEWADRVFGVLPDDLLKVEIEVTGPMSRR